MIDTDKYEGHTSDWKWIYIDGDYHGVNVDNDFYLYSLQSVFGNKIIYDTPDGKLAQDAPLLLAEVKRLQERLDLAERYIIEPTLIRNYFADVVSKGLDDERDNLG